MTIESFQSVKNARGHADPVVLSALSKFEQHLCRTHLRVEIMGERGRKVAVLLTGKKNREILKFCCRIGNLRLHVHTCLQDQVTQHFSGEAIALDSLLKSVEQKNQNL